jgi:hypothetical protein
MVEPGRYVHNEVAIDKYLELADAVVEVVKMEALEC